MAVTQIEPLSMVLVLSGPLLDSRVHKLIMLCNTRFLLRNFHSLMPNHFIFLILISVVQIEVEFLDLTSLNDFT